MGGGDKAAAANGAHGAHALGDASAKKGGMFKSFSNMKEGLVNMIEDADEDQERGLAEGDKAAMARLGSTLFDLIIHYVQTFSTISRSPTAKRIWADWDWMPDFFGWFSMDMFVLPVWDMPEFGVGIQTKMFVLLLPLFFLYWVSELVWADSVKWRRMYVDEWATTKKKLSPYHPLVPVFPSLVTGVGMSMAMLIFVVPKVTITQGISTFLGFYFLQLLYGGIMLVMVSLAKVYYAEYRHETIDEDLPTEHVVDQRPDFFYGIRANGRQTAQMLLGIFYLPLCIGVLHMIEEIRHLVSVRIDALPTCVACNWYTEGIERYVLALNVVEVTVLVMLFTVGAPFYMYRVIKERRKHFQWLDAQQTEQLDAEHHDTQRDQRVMLRGVRGGSKLAQRIHQNHAQEALAAEAIGGDESPRSPTPGAVADASHERQQKGQEKGKWVWTPVSERPHREHDIFQLEKMLSDQQELGVPWFVIHQRIGKICFPCRKRFLSESDVQHGTAVRDSIELLRETKRVEWEYGYEDYQRKQGEMSGMDSMWMCCSKNWIYWKIYTGFFEKYILFALSANMLSSMVNEKCHSTFRAKFTLTAADFMLDDGSWNETYSTEGALDNEYTNNEYTSGLGIFADGGGGDGSSAAATTGSWTMEIVEDLGCERVTALGMLAFCTVSFLLGVICQPFLDVKQDKVDSACRFAGTSTSLALVLAVYEVFDDLYIMIIVLIPNLGAIIYAIYIINPGEMAAALAVEIRCFLKARELGKAKKEEQEMLNNRRLFKAAQQGDFETVSETIKKYDDTLDINYKFPPQATDLTGGSGEKDMWVGLTAIHAAAANGNLRCLRELLNFGLYKYDRLMHDVQWQDADGTVWQPVKNPLQLAWENGCSQVVAMLSIIGFKLDYEDTGREILRTRLVETLVPAGKHPERGAKDLVWILGAGIEELDADESEGSTAVDLDTAVEKAMAALVMRHEWEGLAQFMFATKLEKLELWESWVNKGVISAVSARCGDLLKMFHVEAGTFTTSELLTISVGEVPFSTVAMIFHGALEAEVEDGKDTVRELTMREMMQHHAHAATSFYIVGASRFMEHARPASYKYVSQPFLTDHSSNPTQWTLTLNTRGTDYLDVFLSYNTRNNTKKVPEFVMASMIITCKYVTADDKLNVSRPVQLSSRRFERGHEMMVANFDVSKCQPDSGLELLEIRLSDVFIMDPIRESKCTEIVKNGVAVTGTRITEWRMCGLPHVLPSGVGSSPELFLESNSMVTDHGTIQLALHVDAIEQEAAVDDEKEEIDDEWFHQRLQQLVGSDSAPVKGASKQDNKARKQWKKVAKKMDDGDIRKLQLKQGVIELNAQGRVNALADVEISIISPMIIEALDMFNERENLRQISFTENLSSKARKFVHMESKRRGLQHRSRTNKKTGTRKLVVSKPAAGVECDFPVNIFVGNVGSEPVAMQSFALRIEEEEVDSGSSATRGAAAGRVLIDHTYMANVSLDDDSTHTFGCYNMALKSDLDGGDFPGSLVTIIRYHYDEVNHPESKREKGEAVLVGSPEEVSLLSIFSDLLTFPSSLIPHSFELPEGTAEYLVQHGRCLTKKKGQTLAVAGQHFSEFVLLLEGSAATPSSRDTDPDSAREWGRNAAIGNLRDFLYGCGINHERTAVAKSECRVFVLRRSDILAAARAGPAPRCFSPPSYHELLPEIELEPRTTTLRWVIHGAPELLSGRSSLVSDYFDVPQTSYNQCSWRLHLIPRNHRRKRLEIFPPHNVAAEAFQLDSSHGATEPCYIGVYVACTMHGSLSQKQLDKGSFELSAMHDSGTVGATTGSLSSGYPTRLEILDDRRDGDELGWGFSLGETWLGMVKHERWEIECKLSIDEKHCGSGLGIGSMLAEGQWAVENSVALAQAGLTEAGNLVGGIVIGGEAGKLGDRIGNKLPAVPIPHIPGAGGGGRGGSKKAKRSKSKSSAKVNGSGKSSPKARKKGRETREVRQTSLKHRTIATDCSCCTPPDTCARLCLYVRCRVIRLSSMRWTTHLLRLLAPRLLVLALACPTPTATAPLL